MKVVDFPQPIRPYLMPSHAGRLIYRCLGCGREYGIDKLLYICPECGQVLLIYDRNFSRLKKIAGKLWQQIFDYRKMLNIDALKGIYRFHEFIGPVIPLENIIYLGEG
ncbi:MAG: threonine synthase, partial [Deltaproteobacteria bacterium]|nr:threonine synthase [Deltaproteobacteria bacterium]